MKNVVIIGTGGFALELIPIIKNAGLRVEGCIGPRNKMLDIWLGEDAQISKYVKSSSFLIAIGDPKIRAKITKNVLSIGGKLTTFIDKKSYVCKSSKIGKGSLIYPGACVHAKVSLGMGVLVNSGVSVGHETCIGDFSNISPGATLGGNCRIGKRVHVGIGSALIEKISIADDVTIGAGASVIRTIDESASTYAGVPAVNLSKK